MGFLRAAEIIESPPPTEQLLGRLVWTWPLSGRALTETQVFSRKLPLVVVGQLGRVDVHVVVAVDALDDFPLDLVFGFLPSKKSNHERNKTGNKIFYFI